MWWHLCEPSFLIYYLTQMNLSRKLIWPSVPVDVSETDSMLWRAAVLLQVQTRDVKAMTVLLEVKYSDRYMREAHYPFTELQLLNMFMLLIYFPSSRRTRVAVGQLSGSVQ